MSEIEELYEVLEEAREADQVASACVIYEEILTQEDVENVMSTLLYATDLIDFGNFAQAEATLLRVTDLCDEAESQELLFFNLATLYEKKGELRDAEKHYRLAHEQNTTRGELLLMAANMAFHQGEPAKAEYLVREGLKYQCAQDEAYSSLGFYLASQRRFPEAKTAFQEVLKIDPENEYAIEWIEDLNPLLPD
ncbi:tetratricopeptide repeat protein [bacterium]|jgi:tetratricopeptide (TPR) repeat protein|nr:tetratricopeptide repeat protein [Verrucomicrobiota bacterium]MDA7507291.1 tetratricopeptide repeat protein [Akkermansiaceae bacterium]MDA7541021.1 tetratricopeptide repeat protein [bacterium]MBT6168532.1 tetratricopeptide repeat protein [Verrucomicrobiota bacterium]MBT7214298.1 tetratricopeptide repeat protein [Verrucomicrobiota bacterium]